MTADVKERPKAQARGLGKGLSALMSESYSTPAANDAPPRRSSAPAEGGPVALELSDIAPGKFQPRDHFDATALGELAESIRRNGVVQPIIVRQAKGGKYEIIAGERRWRAAGIAGQRTIPAIVRELDDRKVLEIALVENIQREDLNPLEEAAGYQRLIDEFDYTQEELAGTVHKSRSHIANLMRLLDLPEPIRRMLGENRLSMGHARALIGAPDNVRLAEQVVEKGLSVRQTEKLARGEKPVSEYKRKSRHEEMAPQAQPQPAVNPQPAAPVSALAGREQSRDPDILALEETLSENLGLKVSINDRGQSGEIIIGYDSLEQLDDILRRLGGSI